MARRNSSERSPSRQEAIKERLYQTLRSYEGVLEDNYNTRQMITKEVLDPSDSFQIKIGQEWIKGD